MSAARYRPGRLRCLDPRLVPSSSSPWPTPAAPPGMKALLSMQKASWAGAGIEVSLEPGPGPTVIDNATPCVGGAGCTWELADPGTAWTFAPRRLPERRGDIRHRGGTNVGSYADRLDDAAIAASETGTAGLGPYFDRLAAQLPVIFEPTPAVSLTEIKNTLRGVTPRTSWGPGAESWTGGS